MQAGVQAQGRNVGLLQALELATFRGGRKEKAFHFLLDVAEAQRAATLWLGACGFPIAQRPKFTPVGKRVKSEGGV